MNNNNNTIEREEGFFPTSFFRWIIFALIVEFTILGLIIAAIIKYLRS